MNNGPVNQSAGIGINVNAQPDSIVNIGNLTINNLSSPNLTIFTKQYLTYLFHNEQEKASVSLECLRVTNSLDDECQTLLKVLECKKALLLKQDYSISPDDFTTLLRSERSGAVIKDAVESVYIGHLSQTSEERARNRFMNSGFRDSYCKAVFFGNLASESELREQLTNGFDGFYEHELCAFVSAASRLEQFELARELCEYLKVNYPSLNSEILFSLSSAYCLHKAVNGLHFWVIDSSLLVELESQTQTVLALSERVKDYRVVQSAAVLLATTWFRHSKLFDYCIANVEEAKKSVPQIEEFIELKSTNGESEKKTRELLNEKNQLLSELEFVQVTSAIANGAIPNRLVKKWLDKGGAVSTTEQVVSDLTSVFLNCTVCDSRNTELKNKICDAIESLVKVHSDKLSEINLEVLSRLSAVLLQLELPLSVIKLLQPLIPESPWPSPIITAYAEALFASEQVKELSRLLVAIERKEESFRLTTLQVEVLMSLGNNQEAFTCAKDASEYFSDSPYLWLLILRLNHITESSVEEINREITGIPMTVFSQFSGHGMTLIRLISRTNLILCESVLLEWFLDDPVGMSKHITNFSMDRMKSVADSDPSLITSERCSVAVVYVHLGKVYTKMLLEDGASNEYFISKDSPLGESLAEMNVGDVSGDGVGKVELKEVLSPVVGAFRIASEIRIHVNSGDDCFYSFTVNKHSPVEGFKQALDMVPESDSLSEPEINGVHIPLLMRLRNTHDHEEVKGAFIYLMDKNSNQYLKLNNDGIEGSDSLVLDALSLTYFSLTGLGSVLIESEFNIYVTPETHEVASTWLNEMERPEYLALRKDGEHVIRVTADDIAQDVNLRNLRHLLDHSTILYPDSFDMPEVLVELRDSISITHFSSVKTALSHSMPVLCLDSSFCALYKSIDVPVVNIAELMHRIRNTDQIESHRLARCLIWYGLPVPLLVQDVRQFCSEDEEGQYLAAQLLTNVPVSFKSTEESLAVLSMYCVQSICMAYTTPFSYLSLSEWKHTENIINRCCILSMTQLQGESSEERLAQLIFEVLYRTGLLKRAFNLSLMFFRQFVRGHFLDTTRIDVEIQKLYEEKENGNE